MAFIIDKDGNYIPVLGETSGGGGGTVNLWTASFEEFFSNATLESDTDNNTYKDYVSDLSTLLPNDGAQYEVLFLLACSGGNIVVFSDVVGGLGGYVGNTDQRDQLIIPVGAERKVTLRVYSASTGVYFNSSAYRKIG